MNPTQFVFNHAKFGLNPTFFKRCTPDFTIIPKQLKSKKDVVVKKPLPYEPKKKALTKLNCTRFILNPAKFGLDPTLLKRCTPKSMVVPNE